MNTIHSIRTLTWMILVGVLATLNGLADVSVQISQPAAGIWNGAPLQDTKDGEGDIVSENTDPRSSVTIDASVPITGGETINEVLYEFSFDSAAGPWTEIQTLVNGVDDLSSFTIEWSAAASLTAWIAANVAGDPSLTANESADGNHKRDVWLRVTIDHSGGTSQTAEHLFHLDNEQPQVDPMPQLTFPYYTASRTVAPNWLAGQDGTPPEVDSTLFTAADVAGIDSYRIITNQESTMVLPRIENKTKLPTNVSLSGPEVNPFYIHVRTRDANLNANGANWTETRSWGPIIVDETPPEVTITPNSGSIPCDPITFTVTFNELVDDHPQVANRDLFDPATEISITNGAYVSHTEGTGSEENLVWYVVVDPTVTGPVTLTVAAGMTHDQAGNNNNGNSGTVAYAAGTVAFAAASSSVTEGAGSAAFVVEFSAAVGVVLECEFTVDVVVSGGTAVAGGDYTFSPVTQTVTFGVGDADGATRVIGVPITNDTEIECNETATFQLQNVGLNQAVTLGAQTDHELTIDDDAADSATLHFVASSVTYSENSGAITVAVELEAAGGVTLQCPLSVNVRDLQSGSANGSDYSVPSVTQILTFAPGAANGTTAVALLTITDDSLIECVDETVNFILESVVTDSAVLLAASTLHTAVIQDNDITSISLVATDAAADETGANDGTFAVRLDSGNNTQDDIVVTYIVSGTASDGTDYATISGSATISGGTSSTTIAVDVSSDSLAECDETVVLTLTAVGCGSINGSSSTDTVTITDNTQGVSIVATDNTGTEGVDNASFTVALDNGDVASTNYVVSYTISGTADNGTDYTTIADTVTIPAGANSAAIAITVLDDGVADCSETVTLILTGADDCLVLGATTTADADIDDQAQGVSITASDDHGVEDSDHAEFTVSLDTGDVAEQAYVVSYSITGSASNGTDYATIADTVTIPQGASSASITITVLDDGVADCSETVTLTLTGADDCLVLGATTTADADIYDKTQGVSITASDDTGTEDVDDAAFTVWLDTGDVAEQAYVVSYTISGTADNGTDYTTLSGTVTIPAGATSAGIAIAVLDDGIADCSETVTLTLTGAEDCLVIGGATTDSADIHDRAQGVSLVVTDSFGKEGTPVNDASFAVVLDNGQVAGFDITVSYSISGSAANSSDYATLSGAVTITEGSSSAQILVDVTDDVLVEATESVIATLTGADDCVAVGAVTTGTAEIEDNDTFIDVRVNEAYRENHWVPVRIDVSSVPLQTLVFSLTYPRNDLRYNNRIDRLDEGTGTATIAGPTPVPAPRVIAGSDYFAIEDNESVPGMTKLWIAVDADPQAASSANPTSPPEQGEVAITDTRLGSVLELGFRIRVGAEVKTDSITFVLDDVTAFTSDGAGLPIPERINDPIDVNTELNRGDYDENGIVEPLSDAVAFYRALLWGDVNGLVPILPENQRNPFDHEDESIPEEDREDNDLPHRARDGEIIALVRSMIAETVLGISIVDFDEDGEVTAGRDGPYYVRRLRALSYGLPAAYTAPSGHTGADIAAINTKIDGLVSHAGVDYGEVNDVTEAAFGYVYPRDTSLIADDRAIIIRFNESMRASNMNLDLHDETTIGALLTVTNGPLLVEGVDYDVSLDRDARAIRIVPTGTWASGPLSVDVDHTLMWDVEEMQSSGVTTVTFTVLP